MNHTHFHTNLPYCDELAGPVVSALDSRDEEENGRPARGKPYPAGRRGQGSGQEDQQEGHHNYLGTAGKGSSCHQEAGQGPETRETATRRRKRDRTADQRRKGSGKVATHRRNRQETKVQRQKLNFFSIATKNESNLEKNMVANDCDRRNLIKNRI